MIQWAGMEILDTLDELVDPKHTALLLWDFAENVVLNRYSTDDLVRNSSDYVGTNSPEDYQAAVNYLEKIFDVFDSSAIIESWKNKKS